MAAAIVASLAVAFVFYQIYASPAASPAGYEGIDYDDLVARNVFVIVARAAETTPDRSCFSLAGNNIGEFPTGLATAIVQADVNYADEGAGLHGVASSADVDADNVQAIKLLQKYRFNAAVETTSRNFQRILDNTYAFECYFDHNGNQYLIRVFFDTYYPMSVRFVTVNFTRSDTGFAIANPDILVSSRDVNATVLFVNKLDSTVRLAYDDPALSEGEMPHISERAIPPGKMLQVNYGNYNPPDYDPNNPYTKTFSYTVEPYGISGTVTQHPHPSCITDAEEAKSYYAPDGALLKFPAYLPDGYSLGCSVHAGNHNFIAPYGNSSLLAKFHGSALNDEFLTEGGIRVSYENLLIFSFWDKSLMTYEKSKAPESWAGVEGATIEEIGGNPVVFWSRAVNAGGQERTINMLTIFMDVETYNIGSSLSHDELLKIARSLE